MRYTRLPFFMSGMGSVLEIYPAPHVRTFRRQYDGLNDAQRLALDWYRVGYDLFSVMNSSAAEGTGGKEQEPAAKR